MVVPVPVVEASLYRHNPLLMEAWEPSKGCKCTRCPHAPKLLMIVGTIGMSGLVAEVESEKKC
jgi:hypothetical protein